MAGSNDFTGQNIQDTYQRVLQLSSSGQLADGTGSLVSFLPISASYAISASHEVTFEISSSFAETASYVETAQTASYVETAQTASYVETAQTASYVETAQTASYVETAQTASFLNATVDISNDTNLVAGTNITLAGDTLNVDDAFLKNNADDTTTGKLTTAGLNSTTHITASGDISSSGTITAEHFYSSDDITALGLISASGNIKGNQFVVQNKGGLASSDSTTLELDAGGTFSSYQYGRNEVTSPHLFNGNITASGNISASQHIKSNTLSASANIYAPNIGTGVDNTVVILDSDGTFKTDEIDFRVWGTTLLNGEGVASRVPFYSDTNTLDNDASFTYDGTTLLVSNVISSSEFVSQGNITASGDISASGNILGNIYKSNGVSVFTNSGGTTTINSVTEASLFQGISIRLNAPVTCSSNVEVDSYVSASEFKTTGNISGSTIEGQTLIADVFLSSPSASITNLTNTNITSSGNISASAISTIQAGSGSYHILQGDTSQATGLEVSGFLSATTITASNYITSSIIEGQNLKADVFLSSPSASIINLINTNITSSGNISGSTIEGQTLIADVFLSSPSASIVNLTNTNITSSGNISASGNFIGQDIELFGNSFTMTHATTPTIRLKDTTNNFFVDLKMANNFGIELDGHTAQDFYIATNEYNGTTATTTALFMDGGDGRLSLNDQKVSIDVQGNISASGNISGSDIEASGIISGQYGLLIHSKSSATDNDAKGDIVHFGSGVGLDAGKIYHYKSDGSWEIANATAVATCDGLLGVALATAPSGGILLRGMVTLDHDPGTTGQPLYLDTGNNGQAIHTISSTNNHIVRVIGYCLDDDNGQIWFNPDNTFVEITA